MGDPRVVRASVPFCIAEFPTDSQIRECVSSFAEEVDAAAVRRRLACISLGELGERTECRVLLDRLIYPDGATPTFQARFGTDAELEARGTVDRAGRLLAAMEHPELLPSLEVARPIAPASTAVEAVAARGRGRPPTVPLTDLLSNCMARLPEDLKAKLAMGMPNVIADVEDRIHVAKDQVGEICHQVADAETVEPRLNALEACLCPRGIPSVLQVVTGRAAIVEFE